MGTEKEFITRAFNIILAQFPKFKNVILELDVLEYANMPKNYPYAAICYNYIKTTKQLKSVIIICENLNDIKITDSKIYDYMINSEKEYLESLNLEIDYKTLSLCHLLHEFGHIDQFIDFMRVYSHTPFQHFRDNKF